MKIRHKIALWVAGTGFVISVAFSLTVLLEMMEQPYEILDSELETAAETLWASLEPYLREPTPEQLRELSIISSRYWVRVHDPSSHIAYQSNLVEFADLPLYEKGDDGYTVSAYIPRDRNYLHQGSQDEVAFRVRVLKVDSQKGETYRIQIAKSMEGLEEELSDLVVALGSGLIISTLLLVVISYSVAGRIVKPIAEINRLAKEINEKTLEKRIPLGKSHDELYALSASLNHMFDRLQEAFTMQKQFLADASHELKSPTTMLRLFFEESTLRQELPESFRDQLIRQCDIVLRMERLVKKLLELSVLELAEHPKSDEFCLAELVRSVLEDFSALVAAADIQLEVALPPCLPMTGDVEYLRRMLINVLDNAVKYNVTNGEIRIEAGEEGGIVYISVFNTGIGIPGEDLQKVFQRFYRVEKSRSYQYGGAGLGLSIVKKIVSLHGGTVTMESLPGAWARIYIALPKGDG